MVQTPLPIDAHVETIVQHVRRERSAVVVAPPGSGKTTRIPPALTALGPVILLQPRRVAARALARRIAAERGWALGGEIGWQIRFERNFGESTRLLVATEGILTARLQSDPLLSDFRVVVLDEFHERSIHADLALALVREAAASRDDLAIVVMSATMDAAAVADFLGGPRVFEIEAARHPVEVRYRPAMPVAEAVRAGRGDTLVFLPGVREIERVRAELSALDALVLPLHGTLDVAAQERALAPASRRKVILATNVAETSLTVDGIEEVVDSGLHKVLRYDAATAVDHLVLERISLDSAEQRAGRAGRTRPGIATRLWDARDLLRPHREPEVRRIDLASPVLDIVAWGGDPRTFAWFEPPPAERVDAAIDLLRALGAIDGKLKLTEIGRELRRYPLHPRMARIVVASGGAREAIDLAADGSPEAARELAKIAGRRHGPAAPRATATASDAALRRAILAGYPDRVARRRAPNSERLLLASGTGAVLAREAQVHAGEFLVALDVTGSGSGEAFVRRAEVIEREWLTPTHREIAEVVAGDVVKSVERVWYGAILLHEQTVATARAAVAEAPPPRPAGPPSIELPSGRMARLEYRDDGNVFAAVKLQELFGLAETPRVGPDRIPVTFELLAPNGRPVQVTRDLKSFWTNTYPAVRKELRGRYPRHPWPEDPWTAKATHRTTKRS